MKLINILAIIITTLSFVAWNIAIWEFDMGMYEVAIGLGFGFSYGYSLGYLIHNLRK